MIEINLALLVDCLHYGAQQKKNTSFNFFHVWAEDKAVRFSCIAKTEISFYYHDILVTGTLIEICNGERPTSQKEFTRYSTSLTTSPIQFNLEHIKAKHDLVEKDYLLAVKRAISPSYEKLYSHDELPSAIEVPETQGQSRLSWKNFFKGRVSRT